MHWPIGGAPDRFPRLAGDAGGVRAWVYSSALRVETPRPPQAAGRPQPAPPTVFSVPVILLVARMEYSQSPSFYWSP
eukprot:5223889-Pyramimonas_sp.AAC.1